MKKIAVVAALFIALPFATHATLPKPSVSTSAATSQRLLIMPRSGLSPQNLEKILALHGGRGSRIGKSNLYMVELAPGIAAKGVIEALKQEPQLKFVEEDRLVKAAAIPNDPYLGSQWHTARIGAPAAWDRTQGAGVTIAIVDSGVNGTHPDLAANMVPGYNFIENNTNTNDVCNHGTLVAGVAAGASNNSIGIAGVAGQAKIMPLKIASFDMASGTCVGSYSAIAKAITFAADNGARIVNVSFEPIANSPAIQSAAQYLQGKGGLLFISAGNTGANENFMRDTAMIPVAATDNQDARPDWSNYGNFVALAAPGTGIWSTTGAAGYQAVSGTSFSSAMAAGVGALVVATNPALENRTIQQLLFATAVDLGTPGIDDFFGNGRIDATAAVAAAASRIIAVDSQPPAISITTPTASTTVSALVAVNVVATDNVGVAWVALKVNGVAVATDATLPFGLTWDSAGVANGSASLIAVAYDAAGNQQASIPVTVTVANALQGSSEIWTDCATEGGMCAVNGSRRVRYGANNSYAYRITAAAANIATTIACTNAVFGDPMYGAKKSCQVSNIVADPVTSTPFTTSAIPASPISAPAPRLPVSAAWTLCASENGTCRFTGTREVRYGVAWSYVSMIFTGNAACSNRTFKDPAYGMKKSCWVASVGR